MCVEIAAWAKGTLFPAIINRNVSVYKSTNHTFLKELCIKRFDNDGAFMMTICYKLNIVLSVGGNEHRLSVFVKKTPEVNDEYYHSTHFETMFRNEVIADDILPALDSGIDFPTFLIINIPGNPLYRLHFSHIEHLKAIIAISDFSDDGYTMSKSVVNLSLDNILTSMKALGRFHGASYAMKYANPSHFASLKNQLPESLLRRKHHATYELILMNATRRAFQSIRKCAEAMATVPESFLHDLEMLLINKLNEYRHALSIPQEPLAIICHGDFLRNNIAYKYDSNGMATAALFFDFQTVTYASPMLDVGTFMANSTSHDYRQRHSDEILRTYYDAVINQFTAKTHLSLDEVPNYLSWDAFMKDYTRHAPYCLQVAAYYVAELVDPKGDYFSDENMASMPEKIFTMGGEAVNRETTAQIKEIFDLCEKYNLCPSDFAGDM